MREGPPSCLSATVQLEMGCHPQSHPAQRRQKRRTGHIAQSQEQLHTSWDKHQSHCKLHRTLQALPSFQQLKWIVILAPSQANFSAYHTDHGRCRARQEDSQHCFMHLAATFRDLFRRSSYMKGARQGCQPKPGFRTLQSNY